MSNITHQFAGYFDTYLQKELGERAILGPFEHNVPSTVLNISPLNTAPKKGVADDRRVIMDLSWPKGRSVNDGIFKDHYLGNACLVHYPSLDDFLDLVVRLGPGCLVFKTDLSRAYRQLPVCPADIGLLGFSWRRYLFVDRVLPFGLRSSAMFCQGFSDQ